MSDLQDNLVRKKTVISVENWTKEGSERGLDHTHIRNTGIALLKYNTVSSFFKLILIAIESRDLVEGQMRENATAKARIMDLDNLNLVMMV